MQYAELFCQSNFSFLQGASHPQELVRTADQLGYSALAITDECSLSGVVRAYSELEKLKSTQDSSLKLICGSFLRLQEGGELVLLAPDHSAYSGLCQLISAAQLRAPKGQYRAGIGDIVQYCSGAIAIWLPEAEIRPVPAALKQHFCGRLYFALCNGLQSQQGARIRELVDAARRETLPLVATNAALMHCRSRKPLQDVLNANYHNCTLEQLGYRLQQNAERYLRPLEDIAALYPGQAIASTADIAAQCRFSLAELRYQYPSEVLPANQSASGYLRQLVEAGLKQRWPGGPKTEIAEQIETELAIIAELGYEHYFLTIYDIVHYARSQHILYQGRGSAANSVVCYCLFITEIDPHHIGLLFERFISRERREPPDIDVDFEHERREEIIQYIYQKYGRDRAGLAANKVTYRFKSALRDIGKALGIGSATIERLQAERAWWDSLEAFPQQMQKVGIDPDSAASKMLPQLLQQIYGFPRHLSQHVGGFVITEKPLHTLVPIENAAMDGRTIVQWDKEDIEDLKLMKVDVLALGMLTALRKSLTYMGLYGPKLRLQDIPAQDPTVYAMLSRADTIGVFQIESRAQMSMLPRLQPRNFYELTIEIAIVRPGPIQGGMVHPYLKRKQGLEPVTYPHEKLRPVLERTLGVPIFQEQVIKLSMVAAGFNGGEADQLRRAMASWGKNGDLYQFRDRLVQGMLANGYQEAFAEQLFNQMKGFGAYGFPESHSASFALLAYFSAWIKHHHPAAFYCGLLNSQPMGFYAPAQLVQDAQRHHVKILPVDVLHSHWDHRLALPVEQRPGSGAAGAQKTPETKAPMLRLGMRLVRGLSQSSAESISELRAKQDFRSLADFRRLTQLSREQLALLARADAFGSLGGNRYMDTWQSLDREPHRQAPAPHKPASSLEDQTRDDYASTGLSLREHPVALLRRRHQLQSNARAEELFHIRDGQMVTVMGLVTCRQRPGSASGVLFLTLEDESGTINVVVWEPLQQRFKAEIKRGAVLQVRGRVQISAVDRESQPVIHLVAGDIRCLQWQKVQTVRSFH
ncbi:error-prone DNA polymerase [Microbulbifer sp. TYP-18]|uniref:error-prone DNA polymerase n=1 Tax=Microbulbifer sp. TYP-18 TaxID=3230024 RepID=UPI0034C66AA6